METLSTSLMQILSMQARKWIVSKDYPTISNWCKQYDWDNAIPKKVLPKVGIMIIDKEPICAAGLFIDKTSKLSFMWGIFSNPKASKAIKKKIKKKNKFPDHSGDGKITQKDILIAKGVIPKKKNKKKII